MEITRVIVTEQPPPAALATVGEIVLRAIARAKKERTESAA
jgi:hypothetical protein